jgi:hypothetical protein
LFRNGILASPTTPEPYWFLPNRRQIRLYGRELALSFFGHLDLMLNAVSNSNLAAPSSAAPSSHFFSLISNPSTANGQLAFAQVVHDTLNKSTTASSGQQTAPSKTSDLAVVSQASVPSPLPNAASKTPAAKTFDKQQSQPSKDPSSTLSAFLLPAFVVPPFATIQEIQCEPGSPGKAVPESSAATTPSTTYAGNRIPQPSADTNAVTRFLSQVQGSVVTTAAVSSETLTLVVTPASDSLSTKQPPDLPTPTTAPAAPTSGAKAAMSSATNTETQAKQLAAAAPVTNLTVPSLAIDASQGTTTTPFAPPVDPQKSGITSVVSSSSPNAQLGQALSPVLQQVARLEGAIPTPASASSIAVDLVQTAVNSQIIQAVTNKSLAATSVPHTISAAPALAPLTDTKVGSTNPNEAHAIGATQSAAVTSTHLSSQDSSSDQGGQNSPNSSPSSDSSALLQTKGSAPGFSDVLSGLSVPKPEIVQSAQPAGPAVPLITTPPQPTESTAHLPADALPPALAQAQPSLSATNSAGTSWGHNVSDAQLTTAAGQSEMRIAMQTENLGAIELHARITGDQVGAAIIVEKHDAHAALAVELPALQQALSDKQLRVDQVALTQGSLSSTAGDTGANTQHNQRGTPQPLQTPQSNSFWNESRAITTATWFVPEQTGIFTAQGRLSVQA